MIGGGMLRHTATIDRLTTTTPGKEEMQEVATGVKCLILPLDNKETASALGLELGKAYEMYTNDDTLKKSDKITDSKGLTYYIRGRNEYHGFEGVNHTKYIVEFQEG